LLIAGSGTPREEAKLRRLADQVRAPVMLVGRVSGREKERLLRSSAFVVTPSRYETFCLSALEAMTFGKPVVCFDLPQLRWIDAACAVRVPPGDIGALGRAVQELAGDPQRRAALGRAGFVASRAYDWDVIATRYRGVVDSVLTE
jgi:glycosyltransferase involved in cell wall biosynthesis